MLQLRTERLHLQPLTASDWPLFLQLHSEPETIRYVCDPLPREQIEERFRSRLEQWHLDCEHWLCLVLRDRHSGEALGVTGLRVIDRNAAAAEVGYLLLPRHQGRGLGSESLRALLAYARDSLRLKTLQATVTDGNRASQQVLEKCGFVFERRLQKAFQLAGEDFDDLIFNCRLSPDTPCSQRPERL